MHSRKITALLLISMMIPVIATAGQDQEALSLDSCRTMALANNKELRASAMEIESAYYTRKSAFTSYLPKISASGIYMRTGRELSLLSDDQKATLSHLGDALSMPDLNHVGQGLVDALHTDTRNMAGAAVMLRQPVYTGGKIRAYNRITRYAEKIASDKHNLKRQELIVDVDETYWKIVELAARKRLAQNYLALVEKLDSDIEQMIAEGFATKADGLNVKVKVNEANVAIIQVDNGLEILKMRLCQLCGLPLYTPLLLADENTDAISEMPETEPANLEAWHNRPELNALATSVRLHEEKVRIARAEFLPTIALTGGYFASYPSVFNSFEKKIKGTWNIGVVVNVPLITWGDRMYKEKAERAQAAAARFDFEETREKVELQVSQSRQKIIEARERYAASVSSQAEADENLRYANLGLQEGVIPLINVLQAQTAWLSARTNLISASIDMKLADIYLKKSLGTL